MRLFEKYSAHCEFACFLLSVPTLTALFKEIQHMCMDLVCQDNIKNLSGNF
jgi:hypothetical protein